MVARIYCYLALVSTTFSTIKKKRYQYWTPSGKTFWIRACMTSVAVAFRYHGGAEPERGTDLKFICRFKKHMKQHLPSCHN